MKSLSGCAKISMIGILSMCILFSAIFTASASGNKTTKQVTDSLWLIGREGNGAYTISDDNLVVSQNGWDGTASMFDPIEGNYGYVIGYDMKITSETLNSVVTLKNNDGTYLFMRLIRNSDGSIYNSLQLWDNSGDWKSFIGLNTYFEGTSLHVQFIHQAGSDGMEWRITDPDGEIVYFSETVKQSDFLVPTFFDGLLTLAVGGEGNGSCTFSNPYFTTYDEYLAATIQCQSSVFTDSQQKYTAAISSGHNAAKYSWTLSRDKKALSAGTEPVFNYNYDEEGEYQITVEVTDKDNKIVKSSRFIKVTSAGDRMESNPRDLRSESIASILYTGEDGTVEGWQALLTELIKRYQDSDVTAEVKSRSDVIEDPADLTVISYGESDLIGNTSVEDFKTGYESYIADLAGKLKDNELIVLLDVPMIAEDAGEATLFRHAGYNDAIRQIADKYHCIYTDLFSSTSSAEWTINDPTLISNSIMTAIASRCTALAASSKASNTQYTSIAPIEIPAERNTVAIGNAIGAATPEDMRSALINADLQLDLTVFNTLQLNLQLNIADVMIGLKKDQWKRTQDIQHVFSQQVYKIKINNRSASQVKSGYKTMVVVGDSISDGIGATSAVTTCWVSLVHKMLQDAQGTAITLKNKAISGTLMTKTAGSYSSAIDRIKTDVLDNAPDLLFIAYGFNDQNTGVDIETFGSIYRQYIKTVRNALPGIQIILVGLTYAMNDANSLIIKDYNEEIRLMASENSLPYVDVYNRMYGSNWLLSDGCHPTDLGYRVMADTIYNTLAGYSNLKGVETEETVISSNSGSEAVSSQNEGTNSASTKTAIIILAVSAVACLLALLLWMIRKRKIG